ncbi:cob(I)yrinic acid a,c-diamide adenosyltransferase [Crassaminicella profunda]|uniref:cob(I)yrinic acid a,c-diamide adenosyltransferase n=1 Tax=Crassaminicella profunda TaxID=1286698 RepID=UPI001CA665C1|nr:cob(I)yrinic acid a,c-diamide adenosyltransferase [Crassaminicella profunda]QZY54133.1 cob(I)yrinic acid a,c-diamide adenosyltransferase [Crassaminicella profunda]
MANVYTKTGDKGETGLVGGSRVWKDHLRVQCYGTLDEANSMMGVAYSICRNEEIKKILKDIQKEIFVLGAELASDEHGKKYIKEKIEKKHIQNLEEIIDHYTKKIGPQKEFVIPGKTTASATLHVARTIVRRGERLVIQLYKEKKIREEVQQYINRLSDMLFVLARVEETNALIQEVKDRVVKKLKGHDRYGGLNLCIAKKMAEAAEAKAKSMGVPIVFSVVDEGGNLILIHRMEDSLLASIDISMNKAYTASSLKLPTHEVAKISQPGEMLYGIQNMDRMIVFGGGYPLKIGKIFVGGMGVSGGSVEEDMMIASHALRVFEMEK